MIALANADECPPPPADSKRLWEDEPRVRKLKAAIGKDALGKRRADELTIMRILLSHNADLNVDDGYGATALYEAVDSDKPLLVRELLNLSANPNTKTGIYIDGPANKTPLHRARSKEVYRLLLKHGADPSAKDSWGNVPFEPAE
jgi:ankyrin repeat protein